MMSDVFQHPWLGGLFADPELAAIWSPETQLDAMRQFEVAWSRSLGSAGLVPVDLATAAAKAIADMQFDLEDLRAGTGQDGVVVPRLVAQMKAAAGPAATAVHNGATSQDVIDTATAIAVRETIRLLGERLVTLGSVLDGLHSKFGDEPLMGRTRMQAATMISVGDRLAPWRLPLDDHRQRLHDLLPRVSKVQIGGASGDRAALGDSAAQITAEVAAALNLANPPRAWHAMRDGIAEFASVLSLITGTLGKMGQDIALMAQQGLSEIALSGGGASSAMPHKQNPVQAELLVTLARFNAVQVSAMHHALIHEQERSGTAWALEWMVLPQMAQSTGRALTVAVQLCGQITQLGAINNQK